MINFTDLINKLNEYNNNILQENEKYKKENEELKLQISNLTSKESHNNLLLEKYKKENEEYKNKINTLEEDNTNFKKVSFVQSMNKQLTEKMNYITILEGQLQKYKNKDEIILEVKQNSSIKEEENKEESVKQNKEESVKENTKDTNNKSKKKIEDKKEDKVEEKNIKEKYSNETEFNPDEYEDINGYELLCYKKKYYLRDLETSEIYDINDYKPNKIVGLITKGGKMKLNK
jgi:exonuclease SbcC